jgi:hypothetical protein
MQRLGLEREAELAVVDFGLSVLVALPPLAEELLGLQLGQRLSQ